MDLYFFQHLNLKIRSELRFLCEESVFLQNFLCTNFSNTLCNQTLNRVQLLYDRLLQMRFAQSFTLEALETHENNLLLKSVDFLEIESERVASKIKELGNAVKELKKEIFAFYKDSNVGELIVA